MKRILVATDLSERSDRAIDRAILLAKAFGAQLTVLHVIDEDLPAPVAEAQRTFAGSNLQEHLSSLPNAVGLDAKLAIRVGKDWSEILRQAETDLSDLIVLGSHRARGIQGLFRGTTVERVIRNGNTPVLVARDRAVRPYQRIVVGVDLSVYSRRAVEFALNFAPEAKICLVHAYDVPFNAFLTGTDTSDEVGKRHEQEFTQMVDQEFAPFLARLNADQSKGKLEKVISEGGPHEVIHQQVANLPAELLILGTHGRTGASHALLGSVAESFLNDPPCDVVAVKAW